MNNEVINWYDDNGHLSAEGRAAYVDFTYRNKTDLIPQDVRQHVQTCLMCATDLEALLAAYQQQTNTTGQKPTTGKQLHLRPEGARPKVMPWRWAASIAIPLLIAASLFFGYRSHTNSALFTEYNVVYELPQTRGSGQSSAQEAILLYNAGQYQAAVKAFSAIEGNNTELVFYKAHALLQAKQYTEAILAYQEVIANSNRYDNEATWYLAMAYLAANKPVQARQMLFTLTSDTQVDAYYAKKAQALINDLNSFWRF